MTLGPVRFDNSLSTFTNTVAVSGDLTVDGDVYFNYNLQSDNITSTTNISTSATITTLSAGSIDVGGNIDVGGVLALDSTTQLPLSTFADYTNDYSILVRDDNTGDINNTINSYYFKGVPKGTIIAYHGVLADWSGNNPPIVYTHDQVRDSAAGASSLSPYDPDVGMPDVAWGLCNGATYGGFGPAPDLRERFIVGASTFNSPTITPSYDNLTLNTDFSAVDGYVGHRITVDQLPRHKHEYTYKRIQSLNKAQKSSDVSGISCVTSVNADFPDIKTRSIIYDDSNVSQPATPSYVPNTPPYMALYYIIKLTS